jgi:hypothetical protein
VIRLGTLLRVQEIRIASSSLLKALLIGAFFNQLLPTSVGGDAYSMWYISRRGCRLSSVVATVLLNRVLGVAAMCILVLAGCLLNPDWLVQIPGLGVGVAVVAAGLLVGGILMLRMRPPGVEPEEGRWGVRRKWFLLVTAFYRLRSHRSAIAVAMLCSIVLQIEIVVQYWLFGVSLGVNLAFVRFLVAVPLVTLAAMAPISLNGIGVREWVMIWICVPLGIAESDAAVMALLFFCGNLAYAAVGAVLFAASKDAPRLSDSPMTPGSGVRPPVPASNRVGESSAPCHNDFHECSRNTSPGAHTQYVIPGCSAREAADER